ncbi:MAG: serine/threonine-protein kinase [Cyanobacteria bacterium P01_A01_bin.123]
MSKSVSSRRSNYYPLGLIGQGQFGRVFCGVHRETAELAALKVISRDRLPTYNFLRELRFLISLEHPNIVGCRAIEHTATGRRLVMDYCEGGTLRSWMEARAQLSTQEGLRLIMDVLTGLEHAHSQGIVHCDIKPENILLTLTDRGWIAKISDFGIARLSQEMQSESGNTGSPAYMAPERFYNRHSAASDLYAVGVILFELLLGDRPFSGVPADLMLSHLNRPVQIPTSLPVVVQEILRRSLQKLPARRFSSATEMRAAIATIADQRATALLPTIPPQSASLLLSAPWQAVGQVVLPHPITHLAILPSVLPYPTQPSTAEPNQWVLCGHQHHLVGLQYPDGCITGDISPKVTPLNLPEPLCQLQGGRWENRSGCFMVTQTAAQTQLYYWVPPWRPPLPSAMACQNRALAVTPWPDLPPHMAAAETWWALGTAATAEQPGCLTVGGRNRTTRHVPHPLSALLALFILDKRYGVIVTRQGPDSFFQVFTCRGRWLGRLRLPILLSQVWQTPTPYRLLALATGEQGKFAWMIDLKPFRVFRIQLPIVATLAAVAEWGFVFGDAGGQLYLCDRDGDALGTVQGPANLTALQTCQSRGLLVAATQNGQSTLYSVDIEKFSLDIIF